MCFCYSSVLSFYYSRNKTTVFVFTFFKKNCQKRHFFFLLVKLRFFSHENHYGIFCSRFLCLFSYLLVSAETSLPETVPAGRASTAPNLRTKTSSWSTRGPDCCPWPTPDLTLTGARLVDGVMSPAFRGTGLHPISWCLESLCWCALSKCETDHFLCGVFWVVTFACFAMFSYSDRKWYAIVQRLRTVESSKVASHDSVCMCHLLKLNFISICNCALL